IELARSGTLFNGCGTASNNPLIPNSGVFNIATMVICMVAGTTVIMWMGELITDRGVGNGMWVLIFTTGISGIPGELLALYRDKSAFYAAIAVVVVIAIVAFSVFMENAQRRIPVQYAKRMVGRRMYGGTSTYLPLKVNQAGVIPVIFASSLLYIPQLISQLTGNNGNSGFARWVNNNLIQQDNFSYIAIYFALIIFFTYFYVGITFDPVERADDMKKYGGFIPGIRPGSPTAENLQFGVSRITLPGSLYLGIVAVLPNFFFSITSGNNQNFPFGGTAVLIMVGVGLDTVKQI